MMSACGGQRMVGEERGQEWPKRPSDALALFVGVRYYESLHAEAAPASTPVCLPAASCASRNGTFTHTIIGTMLRTWAPLAERGGALKWGIAGRHASGHGRSVRQGRKAGAHGQPRRMALYAITLDALAATCA